MRPFAGETGAVSLAKDDSERRELVTQLCRASVNGAIKEHGVMCRLTATAFAENEASVRASIFIKLVSHCRIFLHQGTSVSMDGFSFNVSLSVGGWTPLLYDLTTPKKGMTVAMCNFLLGGANSFFWRLYFRSPFISALDFALVVCCCFVCLPWIPVLWFTLRQL
ncbi:hypothetical protein AVEN_84784-1 [Araneus ventricosus]|uniref:Uncharacterized protein n=1 Tax=Araneus ventricosus TaxID=182803 RepID=A0A4Y2N0N7_ARAVE|nr:hypothetical protein AVEN_84784-1 [Araneus ventricosus]